MIDLRHKDPSRGKTIDKTNVDYEDLIDQMIEVSKALDRFDSEGTSRFGGLLISSLDKLTERSELLKRRVADIRRDINKKGRAED